MQLLAKARLGYGFSLLELLLVIATGAVISGSMLQVYLSGHQDRLRQLERQQSLDTSMVVRRIFAEDLRIALGMAAVAPAGVAELVPVERWQAGALFSRPSTAVSGSDVVIVRHYSVTGLIESSNLYYLAHRGGRRDQPAGLYRRRSRPEGGFFRGEELVTGLSDLRVAVCQRRCDNSSRVEYGDLTAVRIRYRVAEDSGLMPDLLTVPVDVSGAEPAALSKSFP
jgi:hypothetical protein